jgi:hypothetical protein
MLMLFGAQAIKEVWPLHLFYQKKNKKMSDVKKRREQKKLLREMEKK